MVADTVDREKIIELGALDRIDDGKLEAIGVVRQEWNAAVAKAWDALSRYKFEMFGYWASKAVSYGQLLEKLGTAKPGSPFKGLVIAARREQTNERADDAVWNTLTENRIIREGAAE